MTNGLMRGMDNSPESIVERVRSLRERAGLTMAQLAKAMGYKNASSIQRYENASALKRGYLRRDLVARFETALLGKGTPPIQRPEIWELAGPEFNFAPAPIPNAIVGPKLEAGGKAIPVYGSAVGGLDGEFEMNGNILYEVLAPPSLSPITGAYAVQVSGESMEPRYFDGEIAFVDPSRRVKKGDFVVAQIILEEGGPRMAFIKRFVRHNASELVLEQYNPPKELRFAHKSVHSVHFVVMGGAAG